MNGPDAAGILSALGHHDRARTLRTARAMHAGRSWAHIAFPGPRGRRRARSATRTGRTWRDQERDGSGRWISS